MEISKLALDEFNQNSQEPSWYKEYRAKCFGRLLNGRMPQFRHGLNINIKPNFNFDIVPKAIVENALKIEYDDKLVNIFSGSSIPEMDDKNRDRVKLFLMDEWRIEEDDNQIYDFNETFSNEFILIHVTENAKTSIKIDYKIDDDPTITSIFVLCEQNSNVQILLNKYGGKKYNSDNVRIITKPGSKVDFISVQNMSKNVVNFQNRKANCQKDSTVNWIDVCLGTDYTKSNVISNLNEEGANSNNTVLYLATGNQKYDVYTASIHAAPNTNSNIITKGVLNESAKALSKGLVRININAAGSNGYEKQDALLLSDTAEADAIPNLEINNHDVKCSHGSTIGQVDLEKLFYLMSRGLSKDQAKEKIVEGYFRPVLDMFDKDVRMHVFESIASGFGDGND